ncbi:MAG TPA: CO dehydrogenase/CO-methylating acetyl-CoA synthase complex subunit beta [Methanomicrobia archaeon]|nr:CO dehydrogenase/CO-methylating acetyl-CoA synthase complex subunit beta [Methanomicrobia archaeon]HEX58558.1 CO dehydrogenase/CO-methylating acetyl-CoA synthase complex subunit beta [Methanomicrobia archaeon]
MAEEEEFPLDVSPMYEGERVRKEDMFVELGGPTQPGFELVIYEPDAEKVKDGHVELIGPDLTEMEEGKAYPYAMIYKVWGPEIDKDLEPVIERRNHEFQPYIQGYMHLNQRDEIWVRISKSAIKKGLKSLKQIGKKTIELFKSELPFIQKMEALYITDKEEVEKRLEEARKIYRARDERTRGLHDEDVEEFYQCTLCQSFAPTNVCVVTPDRPSLCGAMTWFDCRASARVDPEGPNAPIPKGECIDPIAGEYTGVNEAAVRLSGGEYSRIKLHSFLDCPHTSCGCFEVAGFYIPEVDGIGWIHRGSKVRDTPIGLPFSTIAGSVGGGRQVHGFLGIGIPYFYSPKFIQADGGWRRVVWMASDLKERVADAIPDEMKDKIATEKEAKTIDELKEFLKKVDHPVVKGVVRPVDGKKITEGWVEEEAPPEAAAAEAAAPEAAAAPTAAAPAQQPAAPQVAMPQFPLLPTAPAAQPQIQIPTTPAGAPVKIILKDANITIGKIILKKKEEK